MWVFATLKNILFFCRQVIAFFYLGTAAINLEIPGISSRTIIEVKQDLV